MKKRFLSGCCALAALVALSAGTALAEKVAVEMRGQPRPLPATAYMVGSYDEAGRPDLCIVDRAGIADTSGGKMIYYIGLAPTRQTAKNIATTGAFTLALPSRAILAQADHTGNVSAAGEGGYYDKFAATGLKHEKSAAVNAPVPLDAPVVLECKVVKTLEFPDATHKVFFGEVLNYRVAAEALDGDKSKPVDQYDPVKAGALVYAAGRQAKGGYYALSAPRGHRGKVWPQKFPGAGGLEPQPKAK